MRNRFSGLESVSVFLQPGKEEDEEEEEKKEEVVEGPMPLGQLITAFSRAATTEATDILLNDILYISYANIMSQVRRRCAGVCEAQLHFCATKIKVFEVFEISKLDLFVELPRRR